jgi:hypothetical protein
MPTSRTRGKTTSRALAFIAALFIAAIVVPIVFNTSNNPVITIFNLIVSVGGLFFSFVQAFPSMKDHFKALTFPNVRLSTVFISLLLLLSITLNAFLFFTRQGSTLTHPPTASPSAISSNSASTSTPSVALAAAQAYDRFVATHGMMFGFDAAHTHFNPYERILTPANVFRLTQAWTSPKEDISNASPVVVNGVVYIGSDDWHIYALDARTGTQLWSSQTGGSIESSPAVANGVVYVGSNDHKLYAFNAGGCGQSTCPPLWTTTTGDLINSTPVVVNGTVYVGSFDRKVYAFDLN